MKTFLAALCTFWQRIILWVRVTDMLVFYVDNFNSNIMKFLVLYINFTSYIQIFFLPKKWVGLSRVKSHSLPHPFFHPLYPSPKGCRLHDCKTVKYTHRPPRYTKTIYTFVQHPKIVKLLNFPNYEN